MAGRQAPRRLPAPEQLVARARAAAAGPSAPDVPVRDAATVVLVRDGAEGPEVYLLRRHARMAFAPGQAVFPGGGVDPRDREVEMTWAGPPAAEWAVRLRCDGPTARGLICAAVRETFEESGVLLAGDAADTSVADTTGAEWEADRLALESREQSLADLLRRRGLVLRSDLLGAWAHWITPGFEPRRYDTRFFVAVLPAGQRTRDVSSESDAVAWMRPLDALDAVRDGRLAMMPPTEQTCVEIAELGCAADALPAAAARPLVTVEPRLVVEGDDVWLELAGPDEELS
ncbi:MAG: hydrolase [Nocardioidaceae bacterium]|nr:hydrolase [Nocardioidaceae bacterium]